MGLLDRFKRKKELPTEKVEKKEEPSWIEKTCYEVPGLTKEQQNELYGIASDLLFLNPEKISLSYKDARDLAIKFEKSKDFVRAKMHWRIAAGLAIYEKNKEGAKENIEAYAKLIEDKDFGNKVLEYLDQLFWVQEHGYTPKQVS